MTPSMTGATLPKMTPAKKRATRILTPAQIARRKQRQALGISDIRKATPAQLAMLKKKNLSGPSHDEVTERVLDRRKAATGAKPVSIPIVSASSSSGQLSQVGGKKRKKGGTAGGKPTGVKSINGRSFGVTSY